MRVVGFIAAIALLAGARTVVVASAAPPAAAPAPARPAPPDTDGDGIPDRNDKCPDRAETHNGFEDDDGCPDVIVRRAPTPNDVGQIAERIGFLYDSADLKPATSPTLDAIAAVLKDEPRQFPLVALEGHAADNEHTSMKLSLARASAVRVALLARGVESDRLLARASGSMAPTCTDRTEACRTRERTVEFLTLPAPKPSPSAAEAESEAAAAQPKSAPAPAAPPVSLARIEFQKGSAVMAPGVLADLDLLAGFMKVNPVSLEIVGYADNAERRAAALAQSRADAVRAYMMACGVSGQHLVTRTELTARATCRSHSANCPARKGRAEIHFLEPQAPAAPGGDAAPPADR